MHSLTDLADYVMNPEKTAVAGKLSEEDLLENVMHYAARSDKVEDLCGEKRVFVSGINCVPDIAVQQMNSVKEHFGKIGGAIAYHGYQSFKGWETTPEIAHEIGVKLAEQLWGDRYQVLVTTHLDRESHLHNHFVINTVSFVDGIKYHRTNSDYYQMRQLSDELCREYGLSVIERPKSKVKKLSKRAREAKAAIDEAIARASSPKEFESILRGMGFSVDLDPKHKHWTIISAGWDRPIRMGSRLGEEYTNERIVERIANETAEDIPAATASRRRIRVRVRGDFQKRGRTVGLRGLYYHYCYLLGIFPKKGSRQSGKYRYVLKDDLERLDMISAETKLLVTHHIDTAEQLISYRESLVNQRRLSVSGYATS